MVDRLAPVWREGVRERVFGERLVTARATLTVFAVVGRANGRGHGGHNGGL